jgi:ABC-type branched-subunit amino acid transport system substrate-binding protein
LIAELALKARFSLTDGFFSPKGNPTMRLPLSWWSRLLFGLCLSLGLLPGSARAEDLVIGMSAAFRGPSKGLGIELYRGATAYLEEVNQAGGVHGRRVVIKAYDDGYNPIPAIENTIQLIEKDKVFLLFGYVGTPTVTRVLPLTKRYSDQSIFLFFPFTGAQPQRQPPYNEFVFNLRASYQQETNGLVEEFLAIGRKRIAVFYQIDAYGRSGWDGVRRALAKSGLRIMAEATYPRGTPFSQSLRQQVDILRQAQPDAIISVGAYAACAAFVRDARDAGWDVPIANVSFVGSENLLSLLNAAGKEAGTDYTVNLINSQVVPSYYNESLPAVRQYWELMQRYQPQGPAAVADPDYRPLPHGYVSFEGFLNAKVLLEVLRRIGPTLDRSRIPAAAESLHDWDLGIGTPVSFAAHKHQGLDKVYYTVAEKGRFVRLTDWKRWSK